MNHKITDNLMFNNNITGMTRLMTQFGSSLVVCRLCQGLGLCNVFIENLNKITDLLCTVSDLLYLVKLAY